MGGNEMTDPVLLVEKSEGITLLTLNRPAALNALSSDLLLSLQRVFEELQEDSDTGVVILTGAGRTFCAGLDLKEIASLKEPFSESDFGKATNGFFSTMTAFDRPIIGAINGLTITGGFEIALACDILIAAEEATFADTHIRVGITPAGGISQRLPRMIGINRAKELSLTGNFINAELANAWVLVNRVVPAENLLPACRELAADMLSADRRMLREYKQLIDQGFSGTFSEGMALEMEVHLESARLHTADFDNTRQQEVQRRGRKQKQ